MPLVYAGAATIESASSETHERARKIRPEFTRGELVRVAGGRNQAEAELIQNLLIDQGVPSMLRRTAGFDVPDFLAAGPRDVLVPESGAGAARDALRQADIDPADAPASQPASFGGRAARILAGVLAVGLAGAALAWALFELAA